MRRAVFCIAKRMKRRPNRLTGMSKRVLENSGFPEQRLGRERRSSCRKIAQGYASMLQLMIVSLGGRTNWRNSSANLMTRADGEFPLLGSAVSEKPNLQSD